MIFLNSILARVCHSRFKRRPCREIFTDLQFARRRYIHIYIHQKFKTSYVRFLSFYTQRNRFDVHCVANFRTLSSVIKGAIYFVIDKLCFKLTVDFDSVIGELRLQSQFLAESSQTALVRRLHLLQGKHTQRQSNGREEDCGCRCAAIKAFSLVQCWTRLVQ